MKFADGDLVVGRYSGYDLADESVSSHSGTVRINMAGTSHWPYTVTDDSGDEFLFSESELTLISRVEPVVDSEALEFIDAEIAELERKLTGLRSVREVVAGG